MFEGYVLLVDDQPIAAEDSVAALSCYVKPEQVLFAENVETAREILRTRPVQLAFLDIEMPDEGGFWLASYIEEHYNGLPYVFLTGHADFALESYEYEPLDFLTKPVDIKRMGRTFERLERKADSGKEEKIAVRTGADYIFLTVGEILYICKEKRKILIHMKDGVCYQTSFTLEELERIFSSYRFFRCHQSFLIPLENIREVGSSKFGQTYEAVLDDGTVVAVSRSRYGRLKEELKQMSIPLVKGSTREKD